MGPDLYSAHSWQLYSAAPLEKPSHQHHDRISHSDRLSWPWANQFLSYLNTAENVARKRQVSSHWFDSTRLQCPMIYQNRRSTHLAIQSSHVRVRGGDALSGTLNLSYSNRSRSQQYLSGYPGCSRSWKGVILLHSVHPTTAATALWCRGRQIRVLAYVNTAGWKYSWTLPVWTGISLKCLTQHTLLCNQTWIEGGQ